jgi:hypothetical protein
VLTARGVAAATAAWVAVGLSVVGPGRATHAVSACSAVGVTAAVAARAYGTDVKLESLPVVGNAPAELAEIPACFVSASGDVVATVRAYAPKSWSLLIAIYAKMSPRPKRVPLTLVGPGAALYDVVAGPRRYEEDIVFRDRRAVVTIRSAVMSFPGPPSTPLPSLATLARGITEGLQP